MTAGMTAVAGGDGPDDEPPTPIDWDAFDRARDGWRPHEPVA